MIGAQFDIGGDRLADDRQQRLSPRLLRHLPVIRSEVGWPAKAEGVNRAPPEMRAQPAAVREVSGGVARGDQAPRSSALPG
jgi:hypothetical protein